MIDNLRIVLRTDARERFFFCIGNSEPVEGFFNRFGHLRPVINLRSVRFNVSNDFIHVQRGNIGSPSRQIDFPINFQRFKPKIQHPWRIVLALGNIANNFFRQARVRLINRFIFVANVIKCPLNVGNVIFHGVTSNFA